VITNRKSHTRFRLEPNSTNLDDLMACTVSKRMHFSKPHENLNEDRPIYYISDEDVAQCLVSGNADIRGGSLERGRQTTAGLSKTAIFSPYLPTRFGGKANTIYRASS